MGGLITHKLAIRYPDRLLSATIGGMGWMREGDPEAQAFVDMLAKSFDEGKGIAPLIARLSPIGKPPKNDAEIQAINRTVMAINDAKALSAVVRGFVEFAVTEKELLSNKVPTLVMVGTLDPAKVGVDRMKEKLPNLNVVEIAGADHMTTFTSLEFNEALKAFLAKH
jgi:pimeloyl-ACP methyl ester carboxylesterase